MRYSLLSIALYSFVVTGAPLARPEDEVVTVDRHGRTGQLRPKMPGLLSGRIGKLPKLGERPSPKAPSAGSEAGSGSLLGKTSLS